MAIEVRHDVPAGAAAAGAALAGAGLGALRQWEARRRAGEIIVQNDAAQMRQLQALNAQSQIQQQSIQARAQLQQQAAQQAMEQTALRAGLGEKLQEQRFGQELQQMHEAARIQASQVEYQYTAQQKREFAKLNQARQAIMQSREFSPVEKREALRQLDLQQAGIEPSMMPRDPQAAAEEQFAQAFVDENTGALMGFDRSNRPRMLVAPDKMPEAVEAQRKHELALEDARARVKIEEQKQSLRTKLASEPVITTDKDGNKSISYRSADEIEQIMERAFPSPPLPELGEPQPQLWYKEAERQGLNVTPKDKTLPPHVGYAQAMVRTVKQKYGSYQNIPEALRPAFDQALEILEQAQAASQEGQREWLEQSLGPTTLPVREG